MDADSECIERIWGFREQKKTRAWQYDRMLRKIQRSREGFEEPVRIFLREEEEEKRNSICCYGDEQENVLFTRI